MPGTLIPVVEESRMFEDQPDCAIIFSWHIADELAPKLRAKGYKGKLITPLPEIISNTSIEEIQSMAPNSTVSAPPESRAQRRQDIAGTLARAIDCHKRGLLAEAQKGYRLILKKRPNHFDALHLLGVSEKQLGNHEAAMRLIKRALLVEPQSAAARSNLGSLLMALNRFEEAIASYDLAIQIDPGFVDAHYNRGNALFSLGRFTEALASFRKAIAINPRHVNAHNNCGNALHKTEQFVEAIAYYDQAIALDPGYTPAYSNRGAALIELRRTDEAILDMDRAIALAPENADAWNNHGEALLRSRRLDDSLASYDRALKLDPKSELAWLGRANVLMLLRRLAEAKSACQEALAIEPMSAKGLVQLGQCHALQADTEFALSCFDSALRIDPNYETALTSRIFNLDFSTKADVVRHQAARADWWRAIGSKEARPAAPLHTNDRDPDRKLVIGYVSAEFRRRSAAFSYRPVFENCDKAQFEVVCYSNSPTSDDVTETFRQFADRWRDISQWSDDQLVDCIQRDRIDILVDLSGHSDGNRLQAFARKPAPIQVTAWGHAAGTGVPTIDYLFSDPVAIPGEDRHHYVEQIYDLPCTIGMEAPPNISRSNLPPVSQNGFLTYGVFNRVSKISDDAIAVWSNILSADPTSRLIIKDQMLDDVETQNLLLGRFRANGVDPNRISLRGSTDRETHLAAFGDVDICLDPFPHGGGVSTWEALQMGVPVVAKLGNSVASRVSGAILSAIGLTDWVATEDSKYFEVARHPTKTQLEALRRDLPLMIDQRCGPRSYTKAVEDAYREMWRRHCNA
jgi:predicted O-linked N-acetylglucosamine transferase (SPINDLY family)